MGGDPVGNSDVAAWGSVAIDDIHWSLAAAFDSKVEQVFGMHFAYTVAATWAELRVYGATTDHDCQEQGLNNQALRGCQGTRPYTSAGSVALAAFAAAAPAVPSLAAFA